MVFGVCDMIGSPRDTLDCGEEGEGEGKGVGEEEEAGKERGEDERRRDARWKKNGPVACTPRLAP